jgi:UDP-2-acetamido-3-amino-2,3-dideoxy-glucuronate N-acetyltransferase
MAVFDDSEDWPSKLVLYPHRVDWKEGRIPIAHRADATPVSIREREPLMAQAEHFLECVASRRTPLTDIASAIEVLRILDLGGSSLSDGGSPRAIHPDATLAQIHPSAVVDPDVEIGEGTRVWHFVHVMSGARIGRECVLGQNVFVGRDVRIGDRVKIQNNVSVFQGVELEDDVFCGPSCVFTNVRRPRSALDQRDAFLPTRVRQGATLGANSTVICGVEIGAHALVGAGAVVTKDVPPHALVVGNPARRAGYVCMCGQSLDAEASEPTCAACGRGYLRAADGGLKDR